MQRLFDILFATAAVSLFSPLLICISALLCLTGERKVIYRQKRVGKDGQLFSLFKYVTMVTNSENIGAGSITLKNDFRVLPVGKFLRKSKLNELPQLINILAGDMSVIGPRPLHEKQFMFYTDYEKSIISSVRPGLSGVGSIYFRDEEEIIHGGKDRDVDEIYKLEVAPIKAKLEMWYVDNKSMWLYFKLILLTVVAVLLPSISLNRYLRIS